MSNLRHGLDEAASARKVLGNGVLFWPCLGMHYSQRGWEGGTETKGLQWIEGEVCRLTNPTTRGASSACRWTKYSLFGFPLFGGVPPEEPSIRP